MASEPVNTISFGITKNYIPLESDEWVDENNTIGRGYGYQIAKFNQIDKMQLAECRMQNAECRMRNAKCKMQNAKCKMRSAECRVQKAELVTTNIVGGPSVERVYHNPYYLTPPPSLASGTSPKNCFAVISGGLAS